MYVLTWKRKEDFGSIGIFKTLKEVLQKIRECNYFIHDDLKYIDYKDKKKIKSVKYRNILNHFKSDFEKYCSARYQYGNYSFHIGYHSVKGMV